MVHNLCVHVSRRVGGRIPAKMLANTKYIQEVKISISENNILARLYETYF